MFTALHSQFEVAHEERAMWPLLLSATLSVPVEVFIVIPRRRVLQGGEFARQEAVDHLIGISRAGQHRSQRIPPGSAVTRFF